MPKANIVKTVSNPVVNLYMEVVGLAFADAGYSTENLTRGASFNKKDILVTDTINTAIPYIFKNYKNLCVWFQGIAPEESYMRNKSKLRFRILSWMEKKVLKKARLVIFVSEEMKRFYEKKYKLDLGDKSVIMPCFNENGIEPTAFLDKDKYNKNNFVYLGGLQEWQCFEETASLYAEIERKSANNTKFCVFTGQKDKAVEILQKHGIKNYEVDFVQPDELSERIKGIKYGFVLRHDHPVNNVATPTKFSNYLSNGIIPIYSSCVRSFSDYDDELRLGIKCDIDHIDVGAEKVLTHMSSEISCEDIESKCSKAFSDYYNKDKYIKIISEKIKQTKFK